MAEVLSLDARTSATINAVISAIQHKRPGAKVTYLLPRRRAAHELEIDWRNRLDTLSISDTRMATITSNGRYWNERDALTALISEDAFEYLDGMGAFELKA